MCITRVAIQSDLSDLDSQIWKSRISVSTNPPTWSCIILASYPFSCTALSAGQLTRAVNEATDMAQNLPGCFMMTDVYVRRYATSCCICGSCQNGWMFLQPHSEPPLKIEKLESQKPCKPLSYWGSVMWWHCGCISYWKCPRCIMHIF